MPRSSDVSPITVTSFYDWTGPGEYLAHLNNELGRTGTGHDDLVDFLREPMRDLTRWLDNPMTEGMQMLYDCRALDMSALIDRMRETTNGRDDRRRLPKPRIRLSMEVTSKDNLAVRWEPGHVSLRYFPIDAPEWIWTPSSEYAIGARPETEVMFIRGFGRLRPEHLGARYKPIAMLLIMAVACAVKDLTERVKCHFDVQVLTKFQIVFGDPKSAGVAASERVDQVPVDWDLVNTIEDLHIRLETLIKEFPARHGLTAVDFWKACDECRSEFGILHSDKASRRVRKFGDHLTPKTVQNLFEDLKTAIEAGVWTAPNAAPVVALSPKSTD